MAAYFIVNIEIPNQENRSAYDEYIEKVKPIVERYGGRYIVRSERVCLFAGEKAPDRVIIIEFQSKAELDKCFSSPEYTAVKALRENSVRATAIIVEQD